MIERIASSGLPARESGFYDSVYPVIYCDEELYVVDMNKAAAEAFGDRLKDKRFSKHLTDDDLRKVKSLLKSSKKALRTENLYAQTGVVKIRGARYSLVTALDMFGERFAEIRLFRSRREMLSSCDVRKLMFPVEPLPVDYALLSDRRGNEETAAELNNVFSYNMFSHIYESARSEEEEPELFDLLAVLSRIVSGVSSAFRFNSRKWNVLHAGGKKFACPVLSRKNFINLIAFTIYIFSKISNGERSSALIRQDEKHAEIEFSTTLSRSRVNTRGDIVFSYIGTMFPEIRAAAKFTEFICSLYGIGCYAEISKNFTLKLKLVLTSGEDADAQSVKHRKRFDAASLRDAVSLIGFFETAYGN